MAEYSMDKEKSKEEGLQVLIRGHFCVSYVKRVMPSGVRNGFPTVSRNRAGWQRDVRSTCLQNLV